MLKCTAERWIRARVARLHPLDYRRRDDPLTYWRSRSQLEVDFVVGDAVAIEVKAKSRVSARDYRGLLALAEEVPLRRKLVVCHEPCLPCVWRPNSGRCACEGDDLIRSGLRRVFRGVSPLAAPGWVGS